MPIASATEHRISRLLGLGFEPTPQPADVRLAATGGGTHRVDAAIGAMGTRVTITAFGASPHRLEEAVGRAYREMDRLIAIFSRHRGDSALSILNDAGRLLRPPAELAQVLGSAHRFHRLTRGAFDVSVAPLVDLFHDRLTSPAPTAPTAAEVAEVRGRVGARHVSSSRRAVRLRREGMRLTLDGIAKGHIVDAMAAALEGSGVHDYLIDGGGDIRTAGRKPDGRPWAVAVRDPAGASSFLDVVQPGAGAVATSGSYEHFYDPERRFHHLVDAGTGLSPGEVEGVSVVAPTAMAADALATAVFIMGSAPGLRLIDSLAGCACLILDRRGRRLTSRRWRSARPEPTAME